MHGEREEGSGDRGRAGFTLVELLVVMAIIGVLTSLIGVNLVTVRAKARDNQRQADLAALAVALENYRSDQKRYPEQSGGWSDVAASLAGPLTGRYISVLPQDPRSPAMSYRYATNALTMTGTTGATSARLPGSYFALDATLEQPPSEVPSLQAQIVINDNSKQEFFVGGFYADGNKAHVRVVSR